MKKYEKPSVLCIEFQPTENYLLTGGIPASDQNPGYDDEDITDPTNIG